MRNLKIIKLSLICFLSTLFTATSSNATPIEVSTEDHYYARGYNMLALTDIFEESVNNYLEKELDCRDVQLTFNNHKSANFWSDGSYNLTLTAQCNKSFLDFNMEVVYNSVVGIPEVVKFIYIMKGRLVQKSIEVYYSDYMD